MNNKDFDFDQIVIGSGFGGSVSALRLSEKGYKVLILEKGLRREDKDFPTTNLDTKKTICGGLNWDSKVRCNLLSPVKPPFCMG
jgi:choline dehydrogenase-like flavoprotein